MGITQNLGIIPEAGHRRLDAREAFVTKQEAFQDHLTDTFVTEINTLGTQINNEMGTLNVAVATATTKANQASASATTASTKASEANVSANSALTYKNQVMGYVVPSGASYNVDQLNTKYSAMTKAQFNALAEERKANRAGSGFDNFGKHFYHIVRPNVNDGIVTDPIAPNMFHIGWNDVNATGMSKTPYPILNANGVNLIINKVNNGTTNIPNTLFLPTAPNIYPHDTVLTAEQIASGVIKHADVSNSGLIVNGKFDTDTSGWVPYEGATLSMFSGRIRITNNGGTNARATQVIQCVIGKKYTIEAEIYKGTSTSAFIGVSTLANGASATISSTYTVDGRYTIEFTATSTTHYLGIYNGVGNTNYVEFDNIAVYPADAISRSDLVFLELTTSNAA